MFFIVGTNSPEGRESSLSQRFSFLIAHWYAWGALQDTKDQVSLRYSNLIGLGWGLSTGISKILQVVLMCSPGWEVENYTFSGLSSEFICS